MEWRNDQGQDTGQKGKNCAYDATQNITSIRVFMTHAKINEDCSFVLLDGVAALKTTKCEIRSNKKGKDTVLVELSNTRELIWVDKLERWSANQLMGFKPC
jgi:hypothetical protein